MKKYFTLIVLAATCSMGVAQTCDTLFNLQSNLDTPTVIAVDTGGFISGNNGYGDLAKAEAFAVPDSGFYLNEATLYFGYVAINPTDTNNIVTIYAWDNTGTSLTGTNAPGNIIDSVQVTLGQIAQAITAYQGLLAYFVGDSIYTDTIYIGVVLPAVTGDTIALYSNTTPPGPDGNGWELNAFGEWNSYNSDWNVTGGSLGNYISLGICNSLPSVPYTAFNSIYNPSSTCSPNTVSFGDNTTSSPAANSWTWWFGDGATSNLQNPTHVYTAGGSYYVTETATNDTSSVVQVFLSAVNPVTIISSPTVSPFVVPEIDTTYTLSDSMVVDTLESPGSAIITVTGGSGYYFATWSDGTFGDALASTAAGTYTVTVLDQDGCAVTDTVVIPVTLTGIFQISATQQLKVYPNPASDLLNVTSNKDLSGFNFEVFDMLGRMVSTQVLEGLTNSVDVSTLSNGTYIFRVVDKQNAAVAEEKFTVMK